MTGTGDLGRLPAVEARGVVKRYRLGEHVSLSATLAGLKPGRRMQGDPASDEVIDALAGVSFTVQRGECFGVVGTNGSGKSTLMQMIAGITLPNAGSLTVRGRVLPLLSVGSGFHPELTGRENVRLFGAILGIDAEAIDAHLDDIAAFAEVESHMDTPIKRYSDGMQARLSFGVSMLFPADVYLFDEVLAVVDGEFLDRCVASIAGLAEAGRAVLFLSHNTDQIAQLCHRVLWLDGGRVRSLGPTSETLPAYVAELHRDSPVPLAR
jgi:homopolymeric O-antigen transport system ATP-binding protein